MNTTPEFIAERNAAMAKYTGWIGHDESDPQSPAGHAEGIRMSTRLTSYYRQTHRSEAVDVTPQDVIDCIVEAKVTNWVLMGLHGYVGYLPMPRATQDVDIMVPYSQKQKAAKAIAARWPMLEKIELPQVVRFMDPGDKDADGRSKPVIDLMMPWGKFQLTILESQIVVDPKTKHRLPTVEAAIVAKYAALVSPHRNWDKKQQDAVDMRRIMRANYEKIDRAKLTALAAEVWEKGGEEIIRFLELAKDNQPFPI